MESPEGQHSTQLCLLPGVHQNEVLDIENAHDVMAAALVHRDAREAALVDGQHGRKVQPRTHLQQETVLQRSHDIRHPVRSHLASAQTLTGA